MKPQIRADGSDPAKSPPRNGISRNGANNDKGAEDANDASIVSNGASPPTQGANDNFGDTLHGLHSIGTPKNGDQNGKVVNSDAKRSRLSSPSTGIGNYEGVDKMDESDGGDDTDVEALLEGIVNQDGDMVMDMDDEDLASVEGKSASTRKMVASKSTGVTTKKNTDNDGMEAKKKAVEEFQNGSPKTHKIKASKMVKLKQAQKSPDGSFKEAIVLSSSDEEDDDDVQEVEVNHNRGIKDATVDDDEDKKPASKPQASPPNSSSKKAKQQSLSLNSQGNLSAREIEEGERVYCEFSQNKQYYWGQVVSRTRRKKSRFYMYHVRFDDGDEDLDVSSTKMVTVSEYISQFGKAAYLRSLAETSPNMPAGENAASSELPAERMTPVELFKHACGTCENCTKPRCGKCGTCQITSLGSSRCCFQKMCCNIPDTSKLQTYSGLPDTVVGFCFKESSTNPQYNGLTFMTKGGRIYKAFESCFTKTKQPDQVEIDKFYKYVGLNPSAVGSRGTPSESTENRERAARAKAADQERPMTPYQLYVERCGKCQNCVKPDCNKCVCCKTNMRGSSARNCCYHKMCLKIDLKRRAQLCPKGFGNFPDGWTFAFDVTKPQLPHLEGLILQPPPPNSLKYASVARAINHHKIALAGVDAEAFYKYVGLPPNVPESGTSDTSGQLKRASSSTGAPAAKKARVIVADSKCGLSTRELYERRCKQCTMCLKPSCERCRSCKDNTSQTRTFKDACFQKMCCEIAEEEKLQPAKGFPEGWRFFYTDPAKLSWLPSAEHTGIAGLVILSPTGRRFNSVESAAEVLDPDDIPSIARTFYQEIGCHATVTLPDHHLLGRAFCLRWTDIEGKTKIVYGTVIEVTEDLLSGGTRFCKVEFNEKSRSLLNAGFTPNGVSIPVTEQFPQTIAYGGCLNCDSRNINFEMVPFHLTWNVPDVRHEDFVVDEHGMFAPRLTMQFRGYHFTFTAKTSTIPNAGKGVFVSCTPIMGSSDDVFVMNAGELLDLGLYAPFRRADKKTTHIFLMKNFIHSSECEEWNFDTNLDDHLYDITDDATGKIHEIASKHIPAYVNETDGNFAATVYSQHDPEGCVHYLLGHASEEDGPFTLPANGVEKEIFIDYGEQYEDVRVRKNYSRLRPEEAEKRRRELLDLDYHEVLTELKTYNAAEIIQCVNFMMRDVFFPNRKYPVSLVIRALLVTVLFRRHAESMLNDFASVSALNEEEETESICYNGFSQDRMEMVIQKSQNLIKLLFQYCNSWSQIKDILVADELYLGCLEFILGPDDYDAMPPERLGELLVGTK